MFDHQQCVFFQRVFNIVLDLVAVSHCCTMVLGFAAELSKP